MAEEWFVQDGPMNDVAVSTRVRLVRNLTGFCFPERLGGDDRERVASLVKDALNKYSQSVVECPRSSSDADRQGHRVAERIEVRNDQPGTFCIARTANMKESALSLLEERGLRADGSDAVAMLSTGDVCVLINDRDHVRIVAFAAGLDAEKAVQKVKKIDEVLQQSLQFASTREAGYLASSIADCGSAMKISVRVHLPSIVYCDKADIFVKGQQLEEFDVEAAYHDYMGADEDPFIAIGSYYDVGTTSSADCNETDQMARVVSDIKHLASLERKFRAQCADNNKTLVRDLVVRALATVKVASFMDEREAEELISLIKWGVDLGILSGPAATSFARLNYLVRDAHVDAAMQGTGFKFEPDIQNDEEMKRCRIRAVIVGGMLASVVPQ